MKRFLKWVLISVAAVLLLLVGIALFTQTQFFRDQLRSFALNQLDTLLVAEVHLGEIHGNLVGGLSVDSVSLKVQNDYLLTADRLDIRYDLFQIPSKKISVSRLTLVHPQISLIRGRDSVWNIVRMVRPIPDDSTRKKFDWPVAVQQFEIINGSFRLMDTVRLADSSHKVIDPETVEYYNFAAHDVNMRLSSVLISPAKKEATIDSLRFLSDKPEIQLKNISGGFLLTKNEASIKKLKIETSRSRVQLEASVGDIDLLKRNVLSQMKQKPVTLTLKTDSLDMDELRRFIPQMQVSGNVGATIIAQGELDHLHIKQFDLRVHDTDLHLSGAVYHLEQPSNVFLDIKCRQSTINFGDIHTILPAVDASGFEPLGVSTLDFEFEGLLTEFKTTLSIRTEAGSVVTKGASLKIGGTEKLRYNAELYAQNVNLSKLLHDEKFASSLNGSVTVKGFGVTLDDLNARVDVKVDSSILSGKPVGSSRFTVASAKRKLTGDVHARIGSTQADLKGNLDLTDKEHPAFSVDGKVSSLNIADFSRGKSEKSNLTFDVKATGTELQLDRLTCEALIDFSSSEYGDYKIDSSLVNFSIDQRDPKNSSLKVNSSLADFSITGQFDLGYMIGLIRYEAENMNLAIGKRFRALDSTLATTLNVKELTAMGNKLAAQRKVLNTEYELTFKNLQPLSLLAGDRTFDAVGGIKGNLNGNYDALSGGAALRLQEFFYGNADSGMLIQDGIISLKFDDLKPKNPLSDLRLRVKVNAGKMHLNRTKLDTVDFGIFYDKEYAGFSVQVDYNSDIHLRTNGQIGVTDNDVLFTLSRFQPVYKDYVWNVDDGATIAVNQNGMRIQNLILRRDSQSVDIKGSMLEGGSVDVTVTGKRLDLDGLKYVLAQEERAADPRGFEGIANVDAHISGTVDAPLYNVKVLAHDVFFRRFPFGVISGDFTYKDKMVTTMLLIDNRANTKSEKPDLTVQGTLPIDLALKRVDQRLIDKPMDFTISSDGLQMSLLDPLLATFNELSGTLKTNLKIGGSPQHPIYSGQISIDNCAFLFVPNNMHYEGMMAQLEASGERIKILNASVNNISADNRPGRDGKLSIVGDFLLKDLVPSDFNFTINGELVVVNKGTRSSSLSVFGDLFMEIQPPGLRYTGSLETSHLKGPILVRNSNLVFPPTTSSVKDEQQFSIPVAVIDDTSRVVRDTLRSIVARYFATAENRAALNTANEQKHARTFTDGLRYDLDIESAGGNTEIRMVFNAATGEELIANIDGKFTITEDGTIWVGNLDVSRASYTFYGKRFDAEGTISFSGDFLNPELNITAKYEGRRKLGDRPDERILVTLKITGTRFAPKADLSMKINDIDYNAYTGTKSGDVQSDALTFVITGTFPISRSDANDLAGGLSSTVQSTVVGGATSLLTSTFSEFLRTKTGFINSVEVGYETGSTTTDKSFGQRADIRLSGTAFKGYWRYGGKILEDPFSNANFSLLYSFGDIFEEPLLRNFMFEYERKITTSNYYQTETRKDVNSARLFYRFSF